MLALVSSTDFHHYSQCLSTQVYKCAITGLAPVLVLDLGVNMVIINLLTSSNVQGVLEMLIHVVTECCRKQSCQPGKPCCVEDRPNLATLCQFIQVSYTLKVITMRLNYVDPVYLMLHFIRTGVDHLHFRTDKADGSVLDSKLKVSLY